MSSEKDRIFTSYALKLQELEFLWSNPLKPFSSFSFSDKLNEDGKQDKSKIVDNADLESQEKISFKYLEQSKLDLAAATREYYHGDQEPSQTRKRPAEKAPESAPEDALERPRKIQKTVSSDHPRRMIPVPAPTSATKPINLQSQIASLEKETNAYLHKNLAEVDVVSLPESIPTANHNVLSLAELYYLTQTLPLTKLLPGTNKTLMTENFESAILEGKVAVLFSRIEELKRSRKWSLRQPIRYYDPFVYAKRNKKSRLHTWDYLLQEGKWMATDFRESAKYKKLCCVTMAQAVQDFWTYGRAVCVRRKPIEYLMESDDKEALLPQPKEDLQPTQITDSAGAAEDTVMEDPADSEALLISETDVEPDTIDISKLLERPDPSTEFVPPVLPKWSPQEIADSGINLENRSPFKAHIDLRSLKKIDSSILRNLPKFTAFDEDHAPESTKPVPTGESTIVPVSRMLHPMESDDEWHKIVLRDSRKAQSTGLPEFQKGLFGVQSHRRLNFLRPPKPPLIKNIEFRSPTIWLPQDDKLLIHYVAEYCFNWDLISESLQCPVATLRRYESNIERRTPWQCFERYVQLNEKFQFSDMKGLNAYSAQQWLEHAHKAQSTTKRRISPLGVGNESIQRGHRRLRWASMFDAMRKTMRKRETVAAKANARKNTASPDIPAAKLPIPGANSSGHIGVSSSGPGASGPGPAGLSSPGPGSSGPGPSAPSSSGSSSASGGANNGSNVGIAGNGGNGMKGGNSMNGGNGMNGGPGMNGAAATKRAADKIPSPAELSKLKFDRDKSMQEAFLHQQATRSKMMAAVKGQKGSPEPARASVSSGAGGPTDVSGTPQRRLQGPGVSPGMQRPQAGRPVSQQLAEASQQLAGGSMQSPNAQKAAAPGFKRPTTPNGTPLSVEQIQRLLQIQKQRRLAQQQQQQQQQGSSGHPIEQGNTVPSSPNPLARKLVPGSSTQMQGGPANANGVVGGVGSGGVGSGGLGSGGVGSGGVGSGGVGSGASGQKRAAAASATARGRIQFPPAQVSAIINSIQQKNPNLTKDQVTKLAASYLANLQHQQQMKLEQQAGRPASAGELSSANQQSVQARQAQLSRQRMAAHSATHSAAHPTAQAAGISSKDSETQTLSKMQYEERKKLMMQQGGAQYGQSVGNSSKATSSSGQGSTTKGAGRSSRNQKN